jgi:hypothetical protein
MASYSSLSPVKNLEDLSFMIGEWRGTGKSEAQGEMTSTMTCVKSPDGTGLELIQFDDNPSTEKVFYAEHLRISPDSVTGEFKIVRHGFAFADAGEKALEMREAIRKEGGGIRMFAEEGGKNFLANDLKWSKEGDGGLQMEGTTKAGKDSWSYEYHYRRRSNPQS